ncbi:MAG: NAD(P)H-hydrate dehydratase [Ignavibacteriales bacterium]
MIPLYSVQQVRDADDYAINQLRIPGLLLMENASISIIEVLKEKFSSYLYNGPVGILCGKGNNGGDGFAIARHLMNSGSRVTVIYLSDIEELTGDALQNFEILSNLIHYSDGSILKQYKSGRDIKILEKSPLIIDALLGSGVSGALRSPYAEIVKSVNELNAVRVAVDIPTGLDADKGSGEVIFKADLTVTLGELKKGLYVNRGAASSGEILKGYIGISQDFFNELPVDTYIIEPEDAFYSLPHKARDIYKYSAGKVLVVAGSRKLPGAAFMTSSAVLKSGAGASILCFPESVRALVQERLNEVIVLTYNDAGSGIYTKRNLGELNERFEWMDVLAIGPGLGRDTESIDAILETIRQNRGKKMVIDADGLYALSESRYKKVNLENCVLTPHQAEFANLIGIGLDQLQEDIFTYGRKFAIETGAYLVLKGAPTVVFNPGEEAFVNSTGNPGMAKFGTGDVLTGILAGFLAQSDDIEGAIISAVYLHSLSADLLLPGKTEFGIMATDIIDNLPEAIKFLRNSCA